MSDPFILADTTNIDIANTLPLLKEYAWDFIHDVFIYDNNGRHKIVTENEALKVWIYKCLKTERYRYQSYLHGKYNNIGQYGVELEQFIGKKANTQINGEKIREYIKSGLLVNPYIIKINSIDITEQKGDRLIITVVLSSVYGNLKQEVKI